MRFSIFAVAAAFGLALAAPTQHSKRDDCSSSDQGARAKLTVLVYNILDSMVSHNPDTLPLATQYRATENSHPAALGFMTAWRTITRVSKPSLLAIDTTVGSAYFALAVSEGNDELQSVLRGRVKVVDDKITELEIYINRSRGDHGFTFSAAELAENSEFLTDLPSNRTKASRETLEKVSAATFNPNTTFEAKLADDCQFTEVGGRVVDPGPNRNGSYDPLGCQFPGLPSDKNARLNLVIDEETGIVVTGAIIPGLVYPYGNISAFIPDELSAPQVAQDLWTNVTLAQGGTGLLEKAPATGEVLEVVQYYNNKIYAVQVNLYLSGPGMTSVWTSKVE
ncbi:regulator-Ty1 transposition [Fusarium mexicanum]|uniref:Regulator-Ty1 transposition n=1 Tax=Fusarium mexicanum TaxID=751941 RepID=A0A8H5J609_9HYPO|nr:regulator-Ty1 transposition [Fusarium mexicanum]